MDLEAKIADAVRDELRRQAEISDGRLKVMDADSSNLQVQGVVDLEALAMVVAGSVAGGP